MKLYSSNNKYKLYQGNMLDMLEVIEPETIDSIVTDPPYELNFMGKGWDNSGIAFQKETWEKCYEVLKPGGYLLAFGGSRTFHRIACAIEDAGFEIRDTIMWLYGSGFPKSMNLANSIESKIINGNGNKNQFKKLDGEKGKPISYCSFTKKNIEQGFRDKDYAEQDYETTKVNYTTDLAKQWQGWGTALKPSFEPIIVARKPFKGSLVDNVIEYGVGGINIDECRVCLNGEKTPKGSGNICNSGIEQKWGFKGNGGNETSNLGRFPANTILTYDETDFDEVCGGFPNTKSQIGARGGQGFHNCLGRPDRERKDGNNLSGYEDSGSASRYFYCAKASKKDRDEGLDEFEEKENTIMYGDGFNSATKLATNEQIETGEVGNRSLRKNTHPTVKPTELMQYLVRLVSPPCSTILDCFNGSGSTGKAVMYENKERNKNYKYIGIELTEEYLPIAKARIEYVCNLEPEVNPQTNIFDFIGE